MPDQMIENVELEETRRLAESEVERLRRYKEVYAEHHPLPSLEIPAFWKALGLEAAIMSASGISTAIFAAIRTAGVFMIAEQLLIDEFSTATWMAKILPTAAGMSAILGIEGFLFAIGLIKGRSSGKVDTSWWGLIIAMLISATAGIISSASLLKLSTNDPINQVLYIFLALVSGLGCAWLSYLGAHNIGVLRNRYEHQVSDLKENYQAALNEWDEKMYRVYNRQGRSNIFNLDDYSTGSRQKGESKRRNDSPEIASKVRIYLKDNGLSAFDIGAESGLLMTPRALAEAIGEPDYAGAVRTALNRLREEEKSNLASIPVQPQESIPVTEEVTF